MDKQKRVYNKPHRKTFLARTVGTHWPLSVKRLVQRTEQTPVCTSSYQKSRLTVAQAILRIVVVATVIMVTILFHDNFLCWF